MSEALAETYNSPFGIRKIETYTAGCDMGEPRPIRLLNLPNRIETALANANIRSIESLELTVRERTLDSVRGIGPDSIVKIVRRLEDFGHGKRQRWWDALWLQPASQLLAALIAVAGLYWVTWYFTPPPNHEHAAAFRGQEGSVPAPPQQAPEPEFLGPPLLITQQEFFDQFDEALQNGKLAEFRKKYVGSSIGPGPWSCSFKEIVPPTKFNRGVSVAFPSKLAPEGTCYVKDRAPGPNFEGLIPGTPLKLLQFEIESIEADHVRFRKCEFER